MRARRLLGLIVATTVAGAGCTSLLGIDGEYAAGAGGSATTISGGGGATTTTGAGGGATTTTGTGGAGGATTTSGSGGATTITGGGGAGGSGGATTGTGGAGGSTGSCGGGLVDCNGSCTLVDSDKDHCGACNHSCGGAACVGGLCQTAVAAKLPTAHWVRMAVHEPYAFLASDAAAQGTLDRVDLGAALVDHQVFMQAVTAVATEGAKVYWGTGVGSVRRADLDLTNVDQLASSEGSVFQMAVDATSLYWVREDVNGGAVVKANHDGSNAAPLVSGVKNPHGVALTQKFVYYTSEQSLRRIKPDGTNDGPVFTATGALSDLWSDATTVCFAVLATAPLANGSVRCFDENKGDVTLASLQKVRTNVFADADYVWYGVDPTPAPDGGVDAFVVMRVARKGGAPLPVASGEGSPVTLGGSSSRVLYATATELRMFMK